jgi:hypothetical protein
MRISADMRNRPTTLAVLLIAAIALSGCADSPSTPSAAPTPTATPSASPVADPSAASLVVAGAEVRVLDEDGDQIDALAYSSDPAEATEFFSEVFAAAPFVSEVVGDGNCAPDATIAMWGDGFKVVSWEPFHPLGQRFLISASIPDVGGIAVRTTSGVGVGEPIERLQADIPVEQRHPMVQFEGVGVDLVDYDTAEGEWLPQTSDEYGYTSYWGARAQGTNGVVSLLLAPTPFVDVC